MGHFWSKVMDESLKWCKFVCKGPSVETWPCTSQFLMLGPEILTRDLDQAHQNSTWRTQNEKKMVDMWPAKSFPKSWNWWKVNGFFFFFFEFAKYCFGELGPNHVSKFEVRTPKKWAQHSDIGLFWASWPAQLVPIPYDTCDHGLSGRSLRVKFISGWAEELKGCLKKKTTQRCRRPRNSKVEESSIWVDFLFESVCSTRTSV